MPSTSPSSFTATQESINGESKPREKGKPGSIHHSIDEALEPVVGKHLTRTTVSGRVTPALRPRQNSGGCYDLSAENCNGGCWPYGQRIKDTMIWPGLPEKGRVRKTWGLSERIYTPERQVMFLRFQCFQGSSILQHLSVFHSFSLPNDIVLHGYTTFY